MGYRGMMYLTFTAIARLNRGTVEPQKMRVPLQPIFLKRLPFIGGRMWNGGTFHTDDKAN